MVKHFLDGIKLIEKIDINREDFYKFANYAYTITNGWNDFATIAINPTSKWSVVIKTNNNGTKRYSGTEYYPNNWEEFCKIFDYFFKNRTMEDRNESIEQNNSLNYEDIINFEYNKNGFNENLVSEIIKFSVLSIEDFEQDRYWSDSARTFLGLLILSNLNSEKEINIRKLLYQISDINLIKNIITNNIENLEKYSILQLFTINAKIIESDKTL